VTACGVRRRAQVDWFALIQDYVAAGGAAINVIEPVDGFHPSQAGEATCFHRCAPPSPPPPPSPPAGNQLLAEVIWADLSANRPSWLPTVNPFNAEIAALFGDQGGYDA
jgi:acyloxyacyl hydrolase